MPIKCHCGAEVEFRFCSDHFHGAQAWYCVNYPECYSYVKAHADGTPMGTLEDTNTRGLRFKIHNYVDPLWKTRLITRHETYDWLASLVGMEPGTFHVGELDKSAAERVIEILKTQHDYNLEAISDYHRRKLHEYNFIP
jgi:hypothetical protein